MKHGRWGALALLGILCAAAVWGDNNVLDHTSYFQNATNGAKVDANGNALTTESNPLGAQTSGWITLASGSGSPPADTTAVGMADSSAVVSSYAGYVLHGIYIRASLPGPLATPIVVRVALSIRTHVNGLADSINTAQVLHTFNISAVSAANDSIKFGAAMVPTSTAIEDGEIIVTLCRTDAGVAKWATGYGRYIPVEDLIGQGVRLPNFSVRWRVLGPGPNTDAFWVSAYATVLR